MSVAPWLDPTGCPVERPPRAEMGEGTRALHDAIDARIRAVGAPDLSPDGPTLMGDLLGSDAMIAWQEGKAAATWLGEACWSELPPIYGRYGTRATQALIAEVKALLGARAAVVTDCGMQAVALTFDALLEPGGHAICMRQVYNKSRAYLERLAGRIGAKVTVVDDGDLDAVAAAIRPETTLIFAETFTNPLTRAQDPDALGALVVAGRETAKGLRGVLDDTIATAWGPRAPLLARDGIDLVVGSGTKALGGADRDLWGYVAGRDPRLVNKVMDLQALRGGVLGDDRAARIVAGLPEAAARHARRCAAATRLAAFLAAHPLVACVWHPSRPDHPDAAIVAAHYARPGSLLSFRVRDADEDATRHLADVLVTCEVPRYALSFDGFVTKVNHHRTVSEYFTPPPVLRRGGLDRLVRLGVGLEDADDLIACVNWALWHSAEVSVDDLARWRRARADALGLPPSP